MKERSSSSAKEFVDALNADPADVAAQKEREKQRVALQARFDELTKPLLDSLAAADFPLQSIDQLVRTYAPLPRPIVDLLLRALPTMPELVLQEQIVRALGASGVPFDGGPLAELFESTDSHGLRWAIANTMAIATVNGVELWILRTLADGKFGTARQMLPLAAVHHNPHEVANAVLLGVLEEMPGHVALALAESGGPTELEALEREYQHLMGWQKRSVGQAISVIRRRAEERQ